MNNQNKIYYKFNEVYGHNEREMSNRGYSLAIAKLDEAINNGDKEKIMEALTNVSAFNREPHALELKAFALIG